jgi:hypothetical protein
MTTFKEQMAADMAVFFNADEFAEAVTYTSVDYGEKTINVVMVDEDESGQVPAAPGDTMIILAKYADIALPQRGDEFTIDGETWYFVENIGGGPSEGVWHISVSRSARRKLG